MGCGSRCGCGTGGDINVHECGARGYAVRIIEHQRGIQSDIGYLSVCNYESVVGLSSHDGVIEIPLVSCSIGCLDGELGDAAQCYKLVQRLLSDGWVDVLCVNREDHSSDCRECNAELGVVFHNALLGCLFTVVAWALPSPPFKKKTANCLSF